MKKLITLSLSLLLTGCVTTSTTTFTDEQVLSIKEGMTSDEVLALFGAPDDVEVSTCGGRMGIPVWNCTVWRYGDYDTDNAGFYFSTHDGVLHLASYDIDRGGH